MTDFLPDVLNNLAANIAAAFLGIIAAWLLHNIVDRLRFGGWRVSVIKGGETKLDRAISVGKAKEIQQEQAELSVFLKGVASPYGWINCDIVGDGKKVGLLEQDNRARRYTINLDKNPQPPREGPTLTDIMDELRRLRGPGSPAPAGKPAPAAEPCGEQKAAGGQV